LTFLLISCGNSKTPDLNKDHIGFDRIISEVNSKEAISPDREGLNRLVKIVDFLPKNYSIIGDVDYTTIVQMVMDKNKIIEFPNFPVLINDSGLNVRSNSKIFFGEKSLLKLKSSDKVGYSILNIEGVENAMIYSPVIEGDRYRRIDPDNTKGEWGMGIWIRMSKNISIFNPKVSNCWGDGIYIGGGDIKIPNDTILIHQAFINENRRNGISITNGKNIRIIEPVISNTHGTSPESGIDIEPNNNNAIIDNIYIKDPYTFNSKTHGIVIALTGLVGENNKNVNIEIVNHIDEYSTYGFTIADFRFKENRIERKLNGSIIIRNPIWKFNKQSYALGPTKNLYPSIEFINCKIYSDEKNIDLIDVEMQNKMKSETTKNGIFFK
jgi:hypothetical protein